MWKSMVIDHAAKTEQKKEKTNWVDHRKVWKTWLPVFAKKKQPHKMQANMSGDIENDQ